MEKEKLIKILLEVLSEIIYNVDSEYLDVKKSLKDLGADSMDIIEFPILIEERLHISFIDRKTEIIGDTTIEGLASHLLDNYHLILTPLGSVNENDSVPLGGA